MDIYKLGAVTHYLGIRPQQPRLSQSEAIQAPNTTQSFGKIQNAEAVLLSISERSGELKDMYKPNLATQIPEFDPDDGFAFMQNNQWRIFDAFMQNNGIYDSMTLEEKENLQNTLRDITRGLDSLSYTGIRAADTLDRDLSSHEAQLEFVSATAALHHIGEKFLSDDIKEEFEQFIASFANHNARKLVDYRSLDERFKEILAKLEAPPFALSWKEQQENRVISKLADNKPSSEEMLELQQAQKEQFKEIKNKTDINSVLRQVQEQLLAITTKEFPPGNINHNFAKQYVSNGSEKTLNRINTYWESLLRF